MKRIILSALSLILGLGIASAQAPATTNPAAKSEKKEATVAPISPKSQPIKAVAPTTESKPAVKTAPSQPRIESATPSTSTKAPVNASQSTAKKSQPTISPAGPTTKTKKDGTPDRRYKENQKLKNDGTPDKRYKENKGAEKK
jgi:hypothetical protein